MNSPAHTQPSMTSMWAGAAGVAFLSALVSTLYLAGALYMLEVYDRVLPSRSTPTLVGLSILVFGLYAFQAMFDVVRGRLLVRLSLALEGALGQRTYAAIIESGPFVDKSGDALRPLGDLDRIRTFIASAGPAALMDLPWAPLFLALCFAFHFWIGVTALVGALGLIGLALTAELLVRRPTRSAADSAAVASGLVHGVWRNAEVVRAMGMTGATTDLWRRVREQQLHHSRRAADVIGGLGALTRTVRLALQSLVLAVGAYLVIHGEATGGIMVASSILVARALAPVELAVTHWRGFVAARQSWRRLQSRLSRVSDKMRSVTLPPPRTNVSVERLSVVAPGTERRLIWDVSFDLSAGSAVGIVGPSGAGKSTLARSLVGVCTPTHGRVKLDGAPLEHWSRDWLGRHLGYLPQDVELLPGTVAQNIARFSSQATSSAVIDAARSAGVHQLICSFPDGYETVMGIGGLALSAGQRQRIALARALYGDPFLIVLDEPNSNLDAEGEQALLQAIRFSRGRGAVIAIVAHRKGLLDAVDYLLVLAEGRVQAFGPRDSIVASFGKSTGRRLRIGDRDGTAARLTAASPGSVGTTPRG